MTGELVKWGRLWPEAGECLSPREGETWASSAAGVSFLGPARPHPLSPLPTSIPFYSLRRILGVAALAPVRALRLPSSAASLLSLVGLCLLADVSASPAGCAPLGS